MKIKTRQCLELQDDDQVVIYVPRSRTTMYVIVEDPIEGDMEVQHVEQFRARNAENAELLQLFNDWWAEAGVL